jgi:SAM-dependent methyltransferase
MEAELGVSPSEESLRACPINHPLLLRYKARILGGRSDVREFADWTEFLVQEYRPAEICLSLGSGIGRVERYLIKRGFTKGFESIELNPDHVSTANAIDERVGAVVGDLNFASIEEDRYDFILCHGVLHHLINLELVLHQINCALKPGGLLLIYEYVGPTRWQFPEEHLAFLRERFPDVRLRNPPRYAVGGFESVRSGDLLTLIEHYWGDTATRTVNYGSAFHPMIHCGKWSEIEPKMGAIVKLDAEMAKARVFPPCYHMGLYMKSDARPANSEPWSDERMKYELSPAISLPVLADRKLKQLRSAVKLRTRVKGLLNLNRKCSSCA